VVGITNAPREVEPEAIQTLGLASFLSKGRVIDQSKTIKYRMEDVIQLVLTKAGEEDNFEIETEDLEDETALSAPYAPPSPVTNAQEVDLITETDGPLVEMVPNECYVYYGSVRSGQQIAADKGQSLVVIGSVNSGGEVLSDGDIFVFGKLRGRALAGLSSDDRKSRIVATSFDPELVCIGDAFTTIDSVQDFGLQQPGQPAMATRGANGEITFSAIRI